MSNSNCMARLAKIRASTNHMRKKERLPQFSSLSSHPSSQSSSKLHSFFVFTHWPLSQLCSPSSHFAGKRKTTNETSTNPCGTPCLYRVITPLPFFSRFITHLQMPDVPTFLCHLDTSKVSKDIKCKESDLLQLPISSEPSSQSLEPSHTHLRVMQRLLEQVN